MGHSGFGGVNLLFEWFPPYSFHIPLFIFGAGYFYDDTVRVLTHIKKRFRRLVVSHYLWNVFYATLFLVLTSTGLLIWRYSVNLETFFVEPWVDDAQYAFTAAAWFALSLFLIQVAHTLIRRPLKKVRVINSEYRLLMIFLGLGLLSTYLASLGAYSNLWYLNLGRTLFGLPFLQLGYLYKVKLERFDKTSLLSVGILFIVQLAFILTIGTPTFSMLYMDFGGRIVEPFLTSFTGIWLCLQISSVLAAHFSPIKLLRYIGDNSWTIMFNQLFGFWILNSMFFLLNVKGFDEVAYKTNIYFEYIIGGHYQSSILYLLAGISVSLILGYAAFRMRNRLILWGRVLLKRARHWIRGEPTEGQ